MMKTIDICFLAIVLLLSCSNVVADSAYSVEFRQVKYDVFSVQPGEHALRFFWKTPNGKFYSDFRSVKKYYSDNKRTLIFATNGGIFSKNHVPLGLYIENSVQLRKLNTKQGYGNFFLMPNGVFYVSKSQFGIVKTDQFINMDNNILYATQSGPMLVISGHINSQFNKTSKSLFVRSGVGINQSGNAVFAISNVPVNFYTFALLFKAKLHCDNALYLDGAISKMYLPHLGRHELNGNFAVIIAVGN